MNTLIKEEQYVMCIGSDRYALRVQEFIWGSEPWPERFRALICSPDNSGAFPVYGSTSGEAVEAAAEYLVGLELGQARRPETPAEGQLRPN